MSSLLTPLMSKRNVYCGTLLPMFTGLLKMYLKSNCVDSELIRLQ